MNVVWWIVIALTIGIIIAVILIVILLREKGASNGERCSAPFGQCGTGLTCNADGRCISSSVIIQGACNTTSDCIYGKQCISGTCQVQVTDLTFSTNSVQN